MHIDVRLFGIIIKKKTKNGPLAVAEYFQKKQQAELISKTQKILVTWRPTSRIHLSIIYIDTTQLIDPLIITTRIQKSIQSI